MACYPFPGKATREHTSHGPRGNSLCKILVLLPLKQLGALVRPERGYEIDSRSFHRLVVGDYRWAMSPIKKKRFSIGCMVFGCVWVFFVFYVEKKERKRKEKRERQKPQNEGSVWLSFAKSHQSTQAFGWGELKRSVTSMHPLIQPSLGKLCTASLDVVAGLAQRVMEDYRWEGVDQAGSGRTLLQCGHH